MKLLTIVCEAHAQDAVTRLLTDEGAHGWTLFEVQSRGAQGDRTGDIPEFTNVQVEVVLPAAAARVLDRLGQEFFRRYSMIAFESDVRVLRQEKF
jgi:nitrogen regulatory protein PII